MTSARIDELVAAGPTYSFEFFPPKTPEGHRHLARALVELQPLEPSFVSVTYRGGPASRYPTHDLVTGMLRTTELNPMAHLICAGHSRLELADILVQLRKAGIVNLMALGGDPPEGEDPGELRHAAELVELARAIGGFSIGVAAHPAVHPRSPSRAADRDFLAAKLSMADFAVTQSVFSVAHWQELVAELAERGVTKPVIPGIMPLTRPRSAARQSELGAVVPPEVAARVDAAGDDPEAVERTGIELATELCRQLLDAGAPGLHFYTLNRSQATRRIHAELGLSVRS